MTVKLQIIVGICLFLALTVIVYMIKKRSLDLKYALSWLLALVFVLVLLKGDVMAGFFSSDEAVIQKGFAYLKGFAPETIATAILFSMVGYFNGNNKTVWVMAQGLIQTLLVRLPFAYVMSIQPNASLTKIGLAAPISTMVGIVLNVGFYVYLNHKDPFQSDLQ